MYYEFTRRVFRRNAVYKAEYFIGLLNALIGLFIAVAIWSAAYGDSDVIGSITKEQMVTSAVIGMLIRTMMSMDEYLFDHKIRTGELAVDLLKPY
ncbi:hypothetical protein [Paenibacillus kobensis]|uniref:hypothetical protein n=1 Tax=Paenibacillus kobensis TaxID=59841 RepID=UPI000FDCB7CD|nr:hypothetical protein [Paenibacillus kobensis]